MLYNSFLHVAEQRQTLASPEGEKNMCTLLIYKQHLGTFEVDYLLELLASHSTSSTMRILTVAGCIIITW